METFKGYLSSIADLVEMLDLLGIYYEMLTIVELEYDTVVHLVYDVSELLAISFV